MTIFTLDLVFAGEAKEDQHQNQQMDMRGLQPEAIDWENVRSGSHGQGSPFLRPIFQHVTPIGLGFSAIGGTGL